MKMSKHIFLLSALALSISSFPLVALAKEKDGLSAPSVPVEQNNVSGNGAENLGAQALADARRLCQLVVDDDPAALSDLEAEGWGPEVDRTIGNTPYYKEISGGLSYEGIGEAEIWGFVEDYPENIMGYCSFTISDPAIRFSISSLQDMENMASRIHTIGEQVYGTFSDMSSQPSIFIHAYHNADTFTYQITRMSQFSD